MTLSFSMCDVPASPRKIATVSAAADAPPVLPVHGLSWTLSCSGRLFTISAPLPSVRRSGGHQRAAPGLGAQRVLPAVLHPDALARQPGTFEAVMGWVVDKQGVDGGS